VDGFVAHVASFRPIEVLDIRPQPACVPNVTFRQCDLMSPPPDLAASCESLSCLHALEHFGLGRYGDPVDIDGWKRGLTGLAGLLRAGGTLYLSVPIGPERIEFNGHRVFSMPALLSAVERDFELAGFSYVDDRGDLHENVPVTPEDVSRNFGCFYGCGILDLRRRGAS